MARNTDAQYPEGMRINHGPLIDKCKNLWHNCRHNVLQVTQISGGTKMSGLYRKLCRESVDALIPGLPFFYNRITDRIPVPPLDRFMTG
jgi:hypothetical protein